MSDAAAVIFTAWIGRFDDTADPGSLVLRGSTGVPEGVCEVSFDLSTVRCSGQDGIDSNAVCLGLNTVSLIRRMAELRTRSLEVDSVPSPKSNVLASQPRRLLTRSSLS